MIQIFLIAICLLFSACGKLTVDPKPIKVEPVTITHRIVLDTDRLYQYYLEDCLDEVQNPNDQQQVNLCADQKLNEFIAEFTSLI